MGASSGSRASTEPVSRLGPTGVDPERFVLELEGRLKKAERQQETNFVAPLFVGLLREVINSAKAATFALGQTPATPLSSIIKSLDQQIDQTPAPLASGTEAGTAETVEQDSVHEGPVGNAETPKASPATQKRGE